jgi:hypothetical protein
MDESLKDIAESNVVSFTLSATSLGHCPATKHTDPENPTCARVTFSGKFNLVEDKDELEFAQSSLFERHPMMATWPNDSHDFKVYKIDITSIWLIDIYGGAKDVPVDDYYAVEL